MLKVQAVTLRSKLTGYLGGRCPLQSLGRPPISGALRGREKRWPRSLSRRTSSTRCSDQCDEDGQQICRGDRTEPGAGL